MIQPRKRRRVTRDPHDTPIAPRIYASNVPDRAEIGTHVKRPWVNNVPQIPSANVPTMDKEGQKAHGLYVDQDVAVPMAAPFVGSGVVIERPSTWRDWLDLGRLKPLHLFYVFVMNGLGCMILAAAANFGVACAMYRTTSMPITMWVLAKNTIAGDMGVTVLIQQAVTFIITSQLCHHDVRHGIPTLTKPWPPMLHFPANASPNGSWLGTKMPSTVREEGFGPLYMGNGEGRSRFAQFVLWFLRTLCTGSERNAFLLRGLTFRQRVERLVFTGLQGLWLAVLCFWWYWPIAIAITAPLYDGRDMQGTWIPPIIKLIFGGVLGLLTNPIIALLALGAESEVRRCHPDLAVWQEGTPGNRPKDVLPWKDGDDTQAPLAGELSQTAPEDNSFAIKMDELDTKGGEMTTRPDTSRSSRSLYAQ